ncbi:hypothetical protein ISTM_224 [Insectomime virus]|nr:hypothetical protein ISTM_224 [Insectomime virus]
MKKNSKQSASFSRTQRFQVFENATFSETTNACTSPTNKTQSYKSPLHAHVVRLFFERTDFVFGVLHRKVKRNIKNDFAKAVRPIQKSLILMAEFYLVKEERLNGFEFFSIGSTRMLLRYLLDELGRNEEMIVNKITKTGEWVPVEPFEEFVSTFDDDEEEDDLFSIVAENEGTYGHRGVMDAFDRMEQKLQRLAPGIRDRTLKFACTECQVLFRDTKRCGADKCVCLHPCDCETFYEIHFL